MTSEAGKRALIYTRISKDDSGEGKSNQRQEEECRRLAEWRGWEVVGVHEDISISAYTGKVRPGWNSIVREMREGSCDVVVSYHLDRITRTVRELTEIIALSRETDVGIATVTGDFDLTNDTGKMLATIISAVAEQEVERKGARQRLANEQSAREGLPWRSGWRAFGYERDGTLIDSEAQLVREAADSVLEGGSLREVVRRWRALGVSTPRASKGASGWTHNGVRSILLNPRNAGMATYKGEVVGKGVWTPIFPVETHILLKAKLTDPARLSRPVSRGRTASNLLTGIARCATCRETVVGGTGHKGVHIYQCRSYHVSTPRTEADALVRLAFEMAVSQTLPGSVLPKPAQRSSDALWDEAERVRTNLTDLSTSYANDGITLEQLESASKALRARLTDIEERLEASVAEVVTPSGWELAAEFLSLDLEGQRKVLADVTEIELHPKGRGRKNVPITDQVRMWINGANGRRFIGLEGPRTGSNAWDIVRNRPA